ncbi:hypothetical protein [Virgibacillus oceani]|uniref:Lipoprotein n=1 Tax=Virgibacillus oceani TaxID=1479511 RepID=A0A917M1D2_9BACI|nr:hypothetical protein [Virgibacillus oceani]GGG71627.1 hypothetical protein GCM10011398_14900 [Virgibacillus oceani]
MKKRYLFLVILLSCFIVGCSGEKEEGAAYITTNEDSEYTRTFNELDIGMLHDFHLKLTQADKSWVTIWVEGYRNGEKTEPFHLAEFSIGLSPNKVEKGHLGLGIINSTSEDASLFIYALGSKANSDNLKNILSTDYKWNYATGKEKIELEFGQTKIIGAYRQVEKSYISSYDFEDPDAVEQMIKEVTPFFCLRLK